MINYTPSLFPCRYDVVVDATDNRPSHYMINDCCVVLGRLTVYNYNGGLCYRCLFPTPLPTVKHILSKGNPHLVYGARVLVKPYREKSKLKFQEKAYQASYFNPSFTAVQSEHQSYKIHFTSNSHRVYENARLLKIEFEKRRFPEFQHYQMRVGDSAEDLKFSSEGHNEQLEFLSDEDFSDMKDV
ncbi:hypothetical protein P3S68_031287 [Capsicum galapagoense]